VFKAKIKFYLRLHESEMFVLNPVEPGAHREQLISLTEQRIRLLEHAAQFGIWYINSQLVSKMALHLMIALNAAARFEDMYDGE
jgi:hypothetical protein